jgi:hypothetical protein
MQSDCDQEQLKRAFGSIRVIREPIPDAITSTMSHSRTGSSPRTSADTKAQLSSKLSSLNATMSLPHSNPFRGFNEERGF